jgi:cell division protein FtsI/penicillin-binding protein 2
MKEATISGSARLLADLPIKTAGKTGTAQVSKTKDPHSWFTVFAPYENPQIVLTILIENGGEGSSTAVPIAKEILNWYFNR